MSKACTFLDPLEEFRPKSTCDFLAVNQFIGFAAGGVSPPQATWISRFEGTGTASVYTSTSQNIGPASADRVVVVAIACRTGASQTVSSVTIGGVTATIDVQVSTAGTDKGPVALAHLAVPSGTTATIVVTLSGNGTRCSIDAYSLTGLNSGTPTATNSSTASPPSAAVTPSAGGLIIAVAKSDAATSFSWTNGLEDTDTQLGATWTSSAEHENNLPASSRTVTATPGTASSPAMVMGTWR